MSSRSTQLPVALAVVVLLVFGYLAHFPSSHESSSAYETEDLEKNTLRGTWAAADRQLGGTPTRSIAHNYGLSQAQCDSNFPQMYNDLLDSVDERHERGNVTLASLDAIPADLQYTRVLLYDGELRIIEDYGRIPDERTIGMLSSLHRALVADPERHSIPNIEFIMSCDDYCDPEQPLWCLTRSYPPATNWVVPNFGFWSWPIGSLGTYADVQRRVFDIEASLPFSAKIPKLVWRGALNVDHDTRTKLVETSAGHKWSDVEPMAWSTPDGRPQHPSNIMQIEDHCRYKYLAHSEGNTYSGRFKYLLNCESVVVAHSLTWIQPFHRFLVAEGPDQNYVHVEKDYSDLAAKMEYYLNHPEETERIAKNSVAVFRDRYLTPAAEACYWRRLVREYASVAFEPEQYEPTGLQDRKVLRGTPYETYIITGNLDSRPRRHWSS